MKLSVIGLGKLGACSAACFAAKGYEVLGVDINPQFVEAINEGRAPVVEPRLQELITESKGRLSATGDFERAIFETDITFLIVPTPSREDGHFSNDYLKKALSSLCAAFKEKEGYHTFVICSTVSPCSTDLELIPLIEELSGKKVVADFGVAYNPEFIALGSVITNFLNPDMVLIGESDSATGERLEEIYTTMCENRPRISRMSLVSAEITKISLNSYVTMKISFANTLSNLCEEIVGANVDDITQALGADRRVSPYYLKGGLSFGGPCFPRDNRAFVAFADRYGQDATLAKASDQVNAYQVKHLAEVVKRYAAPGGAVAMLGLSYKPNTPVIEESPAIKLIEALLEMNMRIVGYDPLAMDNTRAYFGDRIEYADSVNACFEKASLAVITTPEEVFKQIDASDLIHAPTTIIDCWRLLDPVKLGEKAHYVSIGKCATEPALV